jgi:hypothetical protein
MRNFSLLASASPLYRFRWSRTLIKDKNGIWMLEYEVRCAASSLRHFPQPEVAYACQGRRWESPERVNMCRFNPETKFLNCMGDQLAAELGVEAWAWAEDQTPPRETHPYVPQLRCLPDPE